jgi:integrase
MAVRKLKTSWWVEFMYRGLRVRERSPLNTKAGAHEHEAFLRQELGTHGSLEHLFQKSAPAEPIPTLVHFSERWLRDYVDVNNGVSERHNKRKTLRSYLVPMLGSLPLSEITAARIERLKGALQAHGLCAKSINNHLTILRTCLGSALEWGIIQEVPRFRLLKTTPPAYRYLDVAQANALLHSAVDPTLHTMVLLALRTGLRFSELIALRWEDVDLFNQQLCVRRAEVLGEVGPTKSGRVRYIPLPVDLVEELSQQDRSTRLVLERGGKSLRRPTMVGQINHACDVAGVPKVGWHALRHTYASHLVAAGAPLSAIRELLGHSTIDMTLRYAHLSPAALRSAVDLLPMSSSQRLPTGYQPERVLTQSSSHESIQRTPVLG